MSEFPNVKPVRKKFRHQDGLFIEITPELAVFVCPMARFQNAPKKAYTWELLTGKSRRIETHGITTTLADEHEAVDAALKTAKAYILKMQAIYNTAASKIQEFETSGDQT